MKTAMIFLSLILSANVAHANKRKPAPRLVAVYQTGYVESLKLNISLTQAFDGSGQWIVSRFDQCEEFPCSAAERTKTSRVSPVTVLDLRDRDGGLDVKVSKSMSLRCTSGFMASEDQRKNPCSLILLEKGQTHELPLFSSVQIQTH